MPVRCNASTTTSPREYGHLRVVKIETDQSGAEQLPHKCLSSLKAPDYYVFIVRQSNRESRRPGLLRGLFMSAFLAGVDTNWL